MASRKANKRTSAERPTAAARGAAKPSRPKPSAEKRKPSASKRPRVAKAKPRTEPARAKPAAANAKSKSAKGARPQAAPPKTKKLVAKEPLAPRAVFALLRAYHADAHCELDHRSPFELLVATVLSAQSTDVMVNQVTPELFRRWPTPAALAGADAGEVERVIVRTGFFRQKTKSIRGLAAGLVRDHAGEVPRTLAELVKLPGVGRKTANVVLGVAFGTPEGVVVDTHVQRLSQRLGWTRHTEPPEIETDLMREFPREDWDALGHVLIFHGRRICTARKPACASCPVAAHCPSAFVAENVGRKPARSRAR
ncbi:MAG TPA: endonuclease III [Polyangiaceae bacterium]|nr:endonuclease III [Polyangiaceae bacterium]